MGFKYPSTSTEFQICQHTTSTKQNLALQNDHVHQFTDATLHNKGLYHPIGFHVYLLR